jgi:hypothetical protein
VINLELAIGVKIVRDIEGVGGAVGGRERVRKAL